MLRLSRIGRSYFRHRCVSLHQLGNIPAHSQVSSIRWHITVKVALSTSHHVRHRYAVMSSSEFSVQQLFCCAEVRGRIFPLTMVHGFEGAVWVEQPVYLLIGTPSSGSAESLRCSPLLCHHPFWPLRNTEAPGINMQLFMLLFSYLCLWLRLKLFGLSKIISFSLVLCLSPVVFNVSHLHKWRTGNVRFGSLERDLM